MLFDLGWSEILLIGVVALVFIGPKDLPKALRVAGYWVRKARTLSREFQSSIDQMIREAELDEVRQDLKKATEFDLDKEFHNTIDPTGSLGESLKPPELPDFAGRERTAAATTLPTAADEAVRAAAEAAEIAPPETAPLEIAPAQTIKAGPAVPGAVEHTIARPAAAAPALMPGKAAADGNLPPEP